MISLDDITAEIEEADTHVLTGIISAVLGRYRKLYPDWEVMFLSAPTETPEQRHHFHTDVIDLIRKYAQ